MGVRSVTLVDRDQLDLSAIDPTTGIPAQRDRSLKVEIWYPAKAVAGATPVTYEDAMDVRAACAAGPVQDPGPRGA